MRFIFLEKGSGCDQFPINHVAFLAAYICLDMPSLLEDAENVYYIRSRISVCFAHFVACYTERVSHPLSMCAIFSRQALAMILAGLSWSSTLFSFVFFPHASILLHEIICNTISVVAQNFWIWGMWNGLDPFCSLTKWSYQDKPWNSFFGSSYHGL